MWNVTILLADDHQIVRQGLRALLDAEPDFSVIGEAADGLEASLLVEQLKPDVLVLDLAIPGLNGLEVTKRVRQNAPRTRVVILSMHANEGYVLQALKNGAVAYVLKKANVSELVRAVREAIAGRRYISTPLSERAIEAYIEKAKGVTLDESEKLTDREREVLQLIAEGQTRTQIAAMLSISPRTVEMHRSKLMHKMGFSSQAELIRYALRLGILPPEEQL